MADVVFVMHPHAYRHMTKSRDGLVGSYIAKVTRSVETAALFESPGPGKPPRNRTGISYGKGELQRSISMEINANGVQDVEGVVAVGAEHAKYVLHGTRPHVILPRKPGGRLRFYWFRMGKWAILRKVNHPGTMANNFMERALKKGCGIHGIH